MRINAYMSRSDRRKMAIIFSRSPQSEWFTCLLTYELLCNGSLSPFVNIAKHSPYLSVVVDNNEVEMKIDCTFSANNSISSSCQWT